MSRRKRIPYTVPELEAMLLTQCRLVLDAHDRDGDDFSVYTRAEVMRNVCGLIVDELKAGHPGEVMPLRQPTPRRGVTG